MKLYSKFFLLFSCFLCNSVFANHNDELKATVAPNTVACNGFTYCESLGGSVADEWIESFELNTINNVSGSNGGYADFTDLTTDLIIGDSYPVTCIPGYNGTTFTEFFRIWIDFNIDGDFDDPNELVFDSGGVTGSTSGNITVPFDATGGITAMRVSMKYNSESTPCEPTFSFGEVEDYCVNITGGNGCYIPSLQILDIGETFASLEWSMIDDAINYNVRYREIGTPTWTDVSSSTLNLDIDVLPCTQYELQIQTACDTVSSNYSFSYEFLTLGCGNCIDQNYCLINNANPDFGYIDNVMLNTMNSTTGDDGGYGNYTGPIMTSLEQGLDYDVSVTYDFVNFPVENYFVVWIDFNADGSFDGPFEKVLDSGAPTLDLSVSQNFPVPPTAVLGTTRMRVMMTAFSQETPLSCPDFMTGEYEDYCIEITEGTGCYLPLGIEALDITEETAELLWDEGLVAESFTVRYRELGAPAWITIDAVTDNFYSLVDLESCLEYEFQIRTNCVGAATSFSNSVVFKTFGCGACFDYIYCPSFGNSTAFEHIETFSIGTDVSNSGDNMGYFDFEDSIAFVIRPDSTYEMYMEPLFQFGTFNVRWKVWIDLNSDGDFDEANELIYASDLGVDPITTTFSVPSDAAIGLTKMRVSMTEFGDQGPCDEFFFGEVEDYCITIQPVVLPCTLPQDLEATEVQFTAATMIWEPDTYETAIGYVFRYKQLAETGWEELSTAEPLYMATGMEVCTEYEFQVRSVCPQSFSEYSESTVFTTACFTNTEELENTADISALKIYPNPFKDNIQMDIQLEQASDLQIELLNVSGQMVQSKEVSQLGAGTHHLEFTQIGLSAGIYILKIATDNEVLLRKVIAQ